MNKHIVTTLILVALAGLSSQLSAEMSAEQLEKKKAYFLKYDADSNKSLSQAEFIEMTRVQFEKKSLPNYQQEGAKRFGNKDTNADGKLTFDEWFAQ
ncbi:MAG: hypothetical protein ISQ74_05440 [Puniceicoccaceae bacterium]|nr:hypothetical protein [Puniceicoccaceae bacterium]